MNERSATPSTQSATPAIEIRRVLDAPPERVYDAWTTPEHLKRWWMLSTEYTTTVAEVDLRAGGRYRIGMRGPTGSEHIVVGGYREVLPPSRLVYTWRWESGGDESGESLVTVEFRPHGEGRTELLVRHELLSTEEAREEHRAGWMACLDMLEAIL